MEPTTIIAFTVFALLVAQGFVPEKYRWPMRWLTTFVAGAFVIVDTPTISWPVKLVAWLALVALTVWRWRRVQSAPTQPA